MSKSEIIETIKVLISVLQIPLDDASLKTKALAKIYELIDLL